MPGFALPRGCAMLWCPHCRGKLCPDQGRTGRERTRFTLWQQLATVSGISCSLLLFPVFHTFVYASLLLCFLMQGFQSLCSRLSQEEIVMTLHWYILRCYALTSRGKLNVSMLWNVMVQGSKMLYNRRRRRKMTRNKFSNSLFALLLF